MQFDQLKRREFITLLGAAAVAWPLAARAQSERLRRIGVLMSLAKDDPEDVQRRALLQQGLQQLGWSEGRNLHIEYRSFAGEPVRAQAMAKELVDLKPDLIIAASTPGLVAAGRETRTIPIVFVAVSDPVGQGFVKLHAPDALFMGTASKTVVVKTEGIRTYFENALLNNRPRGAKLTDYTAVVLSDTAVAVSGLDMLTGVRDGQTFSTTGRVTFVVAKREADWQIVQFHRSLVPK